jgi:DNA-binding transcriptional MerR regulator
MQTMNIERLAEFAQVNIDTIRYYERQKLKRCPIVAALSGETSSSGASR